MCICVYMHRFSGTDSLKWHGYSSQAGPSEAIQCRRDPHAWPH